MKSISILKNSFIFLIILAVMAGCKKNEGIQHQDDPITTNIEDLKFDDNFNFETSKVVEFNIFAKTNQDEPIERVRFDILTDHRENGGKQLASGVTNAQGLFSFSFPLPAYVETMVVATRFIGLPAEVEVPVINSKVDATFGGIQHQFKGSAITFKSTNAIFHPMGPWNSQGVPLYLEPENDVIDQQFLNDINTSFPESQPVPDYNPHYLDPDNEYDFKLLEPSDVWVTFIHEGAGYRNVLGYYTYPIGNPPTLPQQIDTMNIIFPNVSFAGSGGGLASGNKVYLGEFPQNTVIGWVLIADGFSISSGTITSGRGIYFSNPDLNPESTPEKRQHAVHLFDNGRAKFILGFEDLNRDGWSDDDFNDAMFYITANPIQSVDMTGYQTITYTDNDSDGDGIPDQFDDYPEDPDRAFNNYYPSEDGFGTLAFEDLWPAKGDYDFNDVVIDYNINQITNGNNQVVEIIANFTLRALGASFKNGFGFQLPLLPGDIASVTGQNLSEGTISLDPNNTEANQSNAVIIVFDNGFDILKHPGGTTGVNTVLSAPFVEPVTLDLVITLTEPKPLSQVGIPPYNPFIFTNLRRGYEIHLPDRQPTNLADMTLLGTFHDSSDPVQNRFYKTTGNLPWAIHVIESFDYPVEKSQITHGHVKMGTWAQSSGQQYSNWFKDLSGYRNSEHIFSR
jgi:LruC domain-containing protein